MKKFCFIILLITIQFTLSAQMIKLPVDEFQRKIIGNSLTFTTGGKALPNEGIGSDTAAMLGLIKNLKKEFLFESKKNKGSESIKAILMDRVSFSYWAMTVYDTTLSKKYDDSIFHYQMLTLPYARKSRNIYLTNETYFNIINNDAPLALRIKLLKQWMKDYTEWSHNHIYFSGHSPHIILSNIYKSMGAYDEAIQTLNEMLRVSKLPRDKTYALDALKSLYFELENWEQCEIYCYEIIKNKANVGKMGDRDWFVYVSAYRSLIDININRKNYDKALELIPEMHPLAQCSYCNIEPRPFAFYKQLQDLYSFDLYVYKRDISGAENYFKKLPSDNDNRSIIIKGKYEYFKLIGDTLQAFRYLDKYAESNAKYLKNLNKQIKSQSARGFEFAKDYEIDLLRQKADNEKLIQDLKLLELERQSELNRLKSETEKSIFQSRAENAELEAKVEKERLEANAQKAKKEQEYKILLLNQDIDAQKKIRTWLLLGLASFTCFLLLLFFQNRSKQKLNKLLSNRNDEIDTQKIKLEKSLDHLKSTQSQLIQSEKMASLGELTAGIAHEIQNPLNFVNNFSEISVDLAKELKEVVEKLEIPEKDKEYVSEIIGDLSQNQEKINHHGKRASSIVKGMLEHSRKSSGTKEPTDINTLTDEYLRLAYHGLRAKDKDFNADLITDFDPNQPKIEVASQDIGRVLLNLITNAFYAVNERSKKREAGYKPTVSVITKRVGSPFRGSEGRSGENETVQNESIQISITDNGAGIPDAIKDKIFQPFFTTKPTGQGTGLGLSLSYDIIKAHGGSITVETSSETGTTFLITI